MPTTSWLELVQRTAALASGYEDRAARLGADAEHSDHAGRFFGFAGSLMSLDPLPLAFGILGIPPSFLLRLACHKQRTLRSDDPPPIDARDAVIGGRSHRLVRRRLLVRHALVNHAL